MRVLAILLIAAGVFALADGKFHYTEDKTAVKLGPVEVHTRETRTVDLPSWAGIAAIVGGTLLLLFAGRKP